MCLQELKMRSMSTEGIRSLGMGRFLKWVAIDVNGASGGLVVFLGQQTFGVAGNRNRGFLTFMKIQALQRWFLLGVFGSLWSVISF